MVKIGKENVNRFDNSSHETAVLIKMVIGIFPKDGTQNILSLENDVVFNKNNYVGLVKVQTRYLVT